MTQLKQGDLVVCVDDSPISGFGSISKRYIKKGHHYKIEYISGNMVWVNVPDDDNGFFPERFIKINF